MAYVRTATSRRVFSRCVICKQLAPRWELARTPRGLVCRDCQRG